MLSGDFADKLEYLIASRGVSRKWLSLKSGVSLMYIGQLLSRQSLKPSLEIAASITKAFGVSLEYLAGMPEAELHPGDLTPEEQQLVDQFRTIKSDRYRLMVLRTINLYAHDEAEESSGSTSENGKA